MLDVADYVVQIMRRLEEKLEWCSPADILKVTTDHFHENGHFPLFHIKRHGSMRIKTRGAVLINLDRKRGQHVSVRWQGVEIIFKQRLAIT